MPSEHRIHASPDDLPEDNLGTQLIPSLLRNEVLI